MSKEVFANLSDSHYLNYISVDGRGLAKLKPERGRAVIRDGQVTFAFSIVLPEAIDPTKHRLAVIIKGTDFVIYATMAQKDAVLIRGAKGMRCNTRIVDGKTNAYFGGVIVPQTVILDCSAKTANERSGVPGIGRR